MKLINQRRFGTSAIMLVVFVALVGFVFVFFFQSGDSDSTPAPDTSASPSPATGAKSSASSNQTSTQATQPAAVATASPANTIVAKSITGTVKDERSGQAVTEAVVVLFNEGKRGAAPQVVDETSGKFRFEDVPLRAGVTYSLQIKAPGLCGEESLNSESVNSQQTISRDVILKPCHNQPPGPQMANNEEPGLTRISDGLSGMVEPLNSIKVWMQILATTWILTLIILVLATLSFMLSLRNQVADGRKRVDHLYDWKKKVEPEYQKNQIIQPATTLLNISPEVSQTLQQMLVVLNRIATATHTLAIQKQNVDREPRIKEETPQRDVSASTPVYQSPFYDSSREPGDWYQILLQGGATSPAPVFVEINSDSSETSPLVSNRRICFDERSNHGSFVVHHAGDGIGWIFPNPRSNFMADHHQVFESLEQRNFEQQITNIAPKRVTLQDGYWQLKL